MANANIGVINCPFGGGKSDVRKDKKGKLYYYNENIGMVKPNLIGGQAYMKKHTQFIGENGSPLEPVKVNNSVNENISTKTSVTGDSVNENNPLQEKPKQSWLEKFMSDDE
jgi:hypothetical protein